MADTFYSRSCNKKQANDVQYNSIKSFRLNIHRYCHERLLCCCLKPDAEERKRARSYKHIQRESSISHIIQQLRILSAACRETRSQNEWDQL